MIDGLRQRIEVFQAASGPKARIAGHRIRVQDVAIWHEKLGMSPDEIVHQYPTITLADVHAALAYYRAHRDEVERAIVEEHAFSEEFRRTYPGPLQENLKRERLG